VVGILISLAIVGVLLSAATQVGRRLMDAVDPEIVSIARRAVRAVPGVRGAPSLRIRWIGHSLRAEVDVTIDPALSVDEAHRLAHQVEERLLKDVRRLAGATVHIGPG
jgi:divalent metal cation (Fe/Co/Zn/Cd) transporter